MTKSFRRPNLQEQVYIDTTVCGDAVHLTLMRTLSSLTLMGMPSSLTLMGTQYSLTLMRTLSSLTLVTYPFKYPVDVVKFLGLLWQLGPYVPANEDALQVHPLPLNQHPDLKMHHVNVTG